MVKYLVCIALFCLFLSIMFFFRNGKFFVSRTIPKKISDFKNTDKVLSFKAEKEIYLIKKGADYFLIKENFSVDTLRQNNVLVDDKWSLINPVYAALIGNSKCTIRYNGRVSGRVYVMEGVSVKILAHNRSFVIVHSFGKTNIECKASDSAMIKIIHHWVKSEVKKDGFVTELEELDYLRC